MMSPASSDEACTAAEAVAHRSRGKLVAYLAARFGDVAAAEDALSEAFASALLVWPEQGCPDNPEAWLLTAARRKLIDQIRRNREALSGGAQSIVAGHRVLRRVTLQDFLPAALLDVEEVGVVHGVTAGEGQRSRDHLPRQSAFATLTRRIGAQLLDVG